MKYRCIILILFLINGLAFSTCSQKKDKTMTLNKLTPEEERIIIHKGTEAPYSGNYYKHKVPGTYHCKRCNAALYNSADKFDSNCGWPSFDDEIQGAVKRIPDADGRRTEIVCAACGGHLGHVFEGEGFTTKDTRHCVNSISLNFVPSVSLKEAYFGAGCFWGVEYYFEKLKGVTDVVSGYMGGTSKAPTYKEVCSGLTGHAEVVKVVYNPEEISFEALLMYFFEIHDFTQLNRQGPDIGTQYRSAIFYNTDVEKTSAQKIINILTKKEYKVATVVEKAQTFWAAEEYHQNYYRNKGSLPYCHAYKKIF